MNLVESLLAANKNFKFENYERVLAFLLDKLPDSKLGAKANQIFMTYLDAHKGEYFDLIAFLVSKHSNFNVQA